MKADPLTEAEFEEIRARYPSASPSLMDDVPRLLATVDAFARCVGRCAAELANAKREASLWRSRAEDVDAGAAVMRQALSFYAHRENYLANVNGVFEHRVRDDHGERARAALRDTTAGAELLAEHEELERLFALLLEADRRGVALWRDGHPERELTLPDRGKLVAWLLERIDALEAAAR